MSGQIIRHDFIIKRGYESRLLHRNNSSRGAQENGANEEKLKHASSEGAAQHIGSAMMISNIIFIALCSRLSRILCPSVCRSPLFLWCVSRVGVCHLRACQRGRREKKAA